MAAHVLKMVCSCGHAPATITSAEVIVGVASQLSVAVAVPVAAGSVLSVHVIVTLDGQVSAGVVLSSTVISCTQVDVFPQSSVAVQVRSIALSWVQPPGVVISVNVMPGVASQLSVAVAVPVVAGSVLSVH
jgi:hypothetical protein